MEEKKSNPDFWLELIVDAEKSFIHHKTNPWYGDGQILIISDARPIGNFLYVHQPTAVKRLRGRRLKRKDVVDIFEQAAANLGYVRKRVFLERKKEGEGLKLPIMPIRIEDTINGRGREYWVQRQYAESFSS